MLTIFPDWSDLGLGNLNSDTRDMWEAELMRLENARYYFDGLVFEEKVDLEAGVTDTPLLYPVGMNLVKMLCLAQADSTYGEWEETPVRFAIYRNKTGSAADTEALELASDILANSQAQSMLWELELDRNVFGGAAIKIFPDLSNPPYIRWTRVPRQMFFPIWDPDSPDELLEVYIAVPMTQEQAKAKYGLNEPTRETIWRVEHWTRKYYENTLDGKRIAEFSGVNPWGIVPFQYIPRLRFNNWWGESLVKDVAPVQDELNMRAADVGEAINYNAHPTRWGMNMPRNFNAKNFPIGSNSFWDLGRSIGSSPPPQVGMLESKSAVAPGVFEYVNFLYDWSRTSVFAPPIAFGEDNGGGQRSGITLEIRMWPLIKATRRSRAYLFSGIQRALKTSAKILQQKRFEDIPIRPLDSIAQGRIVPVFDPIMPRDQAALVDKVVKLMSTDPPSISLETAQVILGRGVSEVEKIRDMLEDEGLWKVSDTGNETEGEVETSISN
jgi:hypothetical protein